jgi:hypothetical protein
MHSMLIRRIAYRVRQFLAALAAYLIPLSRSERSTIRAILPRSAWPLFDAMPGNDQRHGLRVLQALATAGHDHPALLQAAVLHDAAKQEGGVTLFHRVAIVLLKAVRPGFLAACAAGPTPARSSARYPYWVHGNHPQRGAELAAAAGCDPLAVVLIRRHQEAPSARAGDAAVDHLLALLQAADDDN